MTKSTVGTSKLPTAKVVQSSSKIMLICFFNPKRLLLPEFLNHGQTNIAVQCCNILHPLNAAIKAKWPRLFPLDQWWLVR